MDPGILTRKKRSRKESKQVPDPLQVPDTEGKGVDVSQARDAPAPPPADAPPPLPPPATIPGPVD